MEIGRILHANRSSAPKAPPTVPVGVTCLCSLRSPCTDSSSPQISTILFGNFTWGNASLHKSPQFSTNIAQKSVEILARKTPYMGCDVHTHALAQRSSTNFIIHVPICSPTMFHTLSRAWACGMNVTAPYSRSRLPSGSTYVPGTY